MKKLMFAAAVALTGGVWATDYVWTGNTPSAQDWFDVNNWAVDGQVPATYPQAGDKAIFEKDATLNVNNEMSVGELVVNATLTHRRDKWLTVGKISGTGKIVLMNRGRLRNINGTDVDCPVDIEIGTSDTTDCANHSAMPYLQGNGADFKISGNLSGSGHVFLTMAGYKGVRFAGDNSDFTGTVHVDGNNQNRVKFDAASAGFSNGAVIVHGNPDDDLHFSYTEGDAGESGTIRFGSFRTETHTTDHYPIRFNGPWPKYATLEVGANNAEDDALTLKMGENNWNTGLVKLRKVGTGTLEIWHTGHQIGTELVGGTLLVNSADALNGKTNGELGHLFGETTVTFLGGTLKYGRDLWTDPANPTDVTTDWSELVKNSTAAISVDTDGKDVVWSNGAIGANNPEVPGLVKKGDGELYLSSYDDNVFSLFKDASKTHVIEGGTLAIRNGRRNNAPDLKAKILGTGTLRLVTFENAGGWRLRGKGFEGSDHGAFEEFQGTIDWANTETGEGNAIGFMLQEVDLDMHQANFLVSGNPASRTIVMTGENGYRSAAKVIVDAYNHLHPNAVVQVKGTYAMDIKGQTYDSYLNGTLTCTDSGVVRITKTGPRTFAIGPDFSAPEGSTIAVNEGIFELTAEMTAAQLSSYLTLADGVALTGEGTFGAVDLTKHDLVIPVTKETADKETVYTLLTATSVTGEFSSAMLTQLDALNAGEKHGRWKLSKVAQPDGTVKVVLRWAKFGLAIIVK